MIKNKKQAANTLVRLNELVSDKAEFVKSCEDLKSAKSRLTLNGYEGLIKDLEIQLEKYDQLVSGKFTCIEWKTLHDIPEILIGARIAQKISHKELAKRLNTQEQQIQRYEATDYEGASLPKIIEIATVLGVNCRFERTWIINPSMEIKFDLPQGLTQDRAKEMVKAVKESGSILIQ